MKKAATGEARVKSTTPKTINEYLARVPEEARAALEKLRRTIQAAAPQATEAISYQMPTFKHNGGLVAFAAFTKHCSFFPMSTKVMDQFRADLAKYDCEKSTIHFTPEKPLPVTLVKKLVKARLAENEAKQKSRKKK